MSFIVGQFVGHAVGQPVQSSVETWTRNLDFATSPAPFMVIVVKLSGAFATSSSFRRKGRIALCGQYSEHMLHVVHFSLFQTGMTVAIPRVSYFVVPGWTNPSAANFETGRSLSVSQAAAARRP